MREDGIDVIILTHQQKYSYVAGTFHNDFNLGNCIFVWANREPTLLVALAERRRLRYEGYIEDVRNWEPDYSGRTPKSFMSCVKEILEEQGDVKVIGLQMPVTFHRFYAFLTKEFPHVELMDAEPMMNRIMMVKDEEEMELTRRSCGIADAGTAKLLENVRVGITEAELMGHAELEMRRLGCSYYYTPNQCLFGQRIGGGDHMPTDRILVNGNFIYYDLHPVWDEYRTDSFRTIAFGEPCKSYMKMMEVIRKIIPELNAKLVPGASTTDIEQWYLAELKKGGYPDLGTVPLGHGIGTGHLPPTFYTGDDYILEKNVVLAMNSHIYDPDNEYCFTLEYCVAVKDKKGPEILTRWPLDLIVVK